MTTPLSADEAVRHIQTRLRTTGFYTGRIDGIAGAGTLDAFDKAIPARVRMPRPKLPLGDVDFVRHVQTRLKERGYFTGWVGGTFGPLTRAAFDKAMADATAGKPPPPAPEPEEDEEPDRALETARVPPWIAAGMEPLGWHEVRDNARLAAWLKRDGRTLGNPARLPWCGDYVDTALRLALPDEPRPGPLAGNPYWALNWLHFGRRITHPCLGAVAVKKRTGGGHVGFVVGQDAADLYILGGNQNNQVSIARYPRDAWEDFRWPTTWSGPQMPLPRMKPGSTPRTPDEF
ncbi:TIGR02594 family protein [Rubellimicrobium sp. CFH 75288]|uniref:NlpC/P60 family protein n=1 Tax=Rubellimicrobium sp. CFH 75288 TaxID=2697034 RepID=UPI001412AF68|nr:TIGR02594 family protein [Rubellimicrobium sp. CFH 75288]NAZ37130.1 TIGR02594 family protein [Rubellimicrobium sp. CFH 75288]